MIDWLMAVIEVSSPLYALVILPFIVLFLWKKRPRKRILVPQEISHRTLLGKARYFVWWALVFTLVLTLVSPAIPSLKTVVVQDRQKCARDIVNVVDVSGSMKETFDTASNAIYNFAKGRSGDCFTTVIFSGPNMYGSSTKSGFAMIVNYSVQNPEEIIAPIKDGIDDKKPSSQLRQFSQGTRISEGLILGKDFLLQESSAESKALFLISDLGNEDEDNARVLGIIDDLIEAGIAVYVFGVEVSKYSTLHKELLPLIEEGAIHYFDVRGGDDFSQAYKVIDRLEPSPKPEVKTEIVSVMAINFVFLWAAFALWVILMILEYARVRIP